MAEPLTTYGEVSSIPWTVSNKPDWTIATERGHHLFWDWSEGGKTKGPEDFVLYMRTVFPSGIYICHSQSNHAVIWSALHDDRHAVGMRRLKHNNSWIVAVLECSEDYPGSSSCPDKELSLKAMKFVAKEFVRGRDPMEIYLCDSKLCQADPSWWLYLQKLERVVNWKYVEANKFRENSERASDSYPSERKRNDSGRRNALWSRQTESRGSKQYDNYDSQSEGVTRKAERSRSPVKRVVLLPRGIGHPTSHGPGLDQGKPTSSIAATSQRNKCSGCDVSFEQSIELMLHYNSAQHKAMLARQFPI